MLVYRRPQYVYLVADWHLNKRLGTAVKRLEGAMSADSS